MTNEKFTTRDVDRVATISAVSRIAGKAKGGNRVGKEDAGNKKGLRKTP
jgi:hypothetical protein